MHNMTRVVSVRFDSFDQFQRIALVSLVLYFSHCGDSCAFSFFVFDWLPSFPIRNDVAQGGGFQILDISLGLSVVQRGQQTEQNGHTRWLTVLRLPPEGIEETWRPCFDSGKDLQQLPHC